MADIFSQVINMNLFAYFYMPILPSVLPIVFAGNIWAYACYRLSILYTVKMPNVLGSLMPIWVAKFVSVFPLLFSFSYSYFYINLTRKITVL